ncbi:sulfotransferase domain-containing protein [Qipengyuania sp.]|uniref:sulfotransferase domain-containing protein n=1 Tax=Qipengyuania sp. TaxID=2004515 RepID=UPI003AF7B347
MTPTYPRKTREMHNHHFDSTVWNDFVFRPDDVVISTYAKSGTTWTQQIVGQLIFQGAADVPIAAMSPWVDLRLPSKAEKLALLEAQTHRRFIKTHLPVDALRFSEQARYIYIGRDGRDVLWSMYHHHSTANEAFYAALNDTPGRVGPPIEPPPADIRDYFHDWLDRDGHPFWPFWENVRSWWDIRGLPNVLLVHFADLKRDMEGEIRRIADFLEIQVPRERWSAILEHSSFAWMKEHADASAPLGGALWQGGGRTFINKGVNGRWRDVLTPAEVHKYEEAVRRNLSFECGAWLAAGSHAVAELDHRRSGAARHSPPGIDAGDRPWCM